YGMTMHLWPKVTGRNWWSRNLNAWHFWLSAMGLWVMFVDLMIAGLVQGYMWRAMAQWSDSTIASHSFWFLRTLAGVSIVVGHVLLLINMIATARSPKAAAHVDADYAPYEVIEQETPAYGTV
ncbi:MAG: cbb3-type cytochrome c oxidase subunit I, partial [Phycisphaeraceae bacterium]|nr:cbb3-type cytochrome c oxidase subunit I [Phycisphaeraceae bacterium]